jgi:ADP-glucose pyrophosphorylase
VDAFWAANLDLASDLPELNLYDREWPIWTYIRTGTKSCLSPRWISSATDLSDLATWRAPARCWSRACR